MIVVLSGGTGTPKLLQGLMEVIPQEEIRVIINTAEDHWLPHGYFSPDVDTVLYTLSGLIDDKIWHGINGDTYHTHERLLKLGYREPLMIGDLDRATHIHRGELMRGGKTLSEVIALQVEKMGVKSRVFPMSDDAVETVILTPKGKLSFHEFWVDNLGTPEVNGVFFRGIEKARGCRGALRAIDEADGVIIGPSNPVSSILPIISIKDIRDRLASRRKRVAISPIIGRKPVSGPADKFLQGMGYESSSSSVAAMYQGLVNHFIIDNEDKTLIQGVRVHKAGTLMRSLEDKKRLAEFILKVLDLF
ncbi:MAG: 2-phospho-L-lactate transferase [Candidatus Hydrothermarchaeota archaeon]|nr:2-phospho-L-lactate transferase [Candidatus Hydrothermarchaeota archaeon]